MIPKCFFFFFFKKDNTLACRRAKSTFCYLKEKILKPT